MRFHLAVLGLVTCICMAGVAYGGNPESLSRETALLANEVAAKIVYPGSNVLVSGDACRLNINFEAVQASFHLPLQGTVVAETDAEDGIIVKNKGMIRTIRDRAPEYFEHLTLRFNRLNVKSVMKTFTDAIAACNSKGTTLAARN